MRAGKGKEAGSSPCVTEKMKSQSDTRPKDLSRNHGVFIGDSVAQGCTCELTVLSDFLVA